jgi:hypothetical protein
MSRALAAAIVGLLLVGCAAQSQNSPPYNGYGLSGGPGGIGSAQGPMPYGDIPGAAPPPGN